MGVAEQCERVLRTLPLWFGIESSLLEYVQDTERFPTFVARAGTDILGFVTVREHFAEAWEVHCIAVTAAARNQGVGRALHAHVERWLTARGVRLLQVKTRGYSCGPFWSPARGRPDSSPRRVRVRSLSWLSGVSRTSAAESGAAMCTDTR